MQLDHPVARRRLWLRSTGRLCPPPFGRRTRLSVCALCCCLLTPSWYAFRVTDQPTGVTPDWSPDLTPSSPICILDCFYQYDRLYRSLSERKIPQIMISPAGKPAPNHQAEVAAAMLQAHVTCMTGTAIQAISLTDVFSRRSTPNHGQWCLRTADMHQSVLQSVAAPPAPWMSICRPMMAPARPPGRAMTFTPLSRIRFSRDSPGSMNTESRFSVPAGPAPPQHPSGSSPNHCRSGAVAPAHSAPCPPSIKKEMALNRA